MRGNKFAKFIDRVIGKLLVRLLVITRTKRAKPTSFNTIGLFKEAALGDTVLLTGILKGIRAQYPHSKIILYTGSSNAILAPYISELDAHIELSIGNPFKAIRQIREESLDILFDFGQWPRINALISYFSNAKYTVGFETKDQHRHYLYDYTVKHSSTVHEIDNFFKLVSPLDLEEKYKMPLFTPAIENISSPSEPYVIFHMHPGGYLSHLKEWPLNHWQEFAKYILEQNFDIYLTGAPSDKEKNLAAGFGINYAGESFDKTLALIKYAKLVVSVNTGIMHIASSIGVPTISLNGPTNPDRWGPLGKNTSSINPDCDGCGYLNLGSEYAGNREDCMNFITPENLIKTTQDYLN